MIPYQYIQLRRPRQLERGPEAGQIDVLVFNKRAEMWSEDAAGYRMLDEYIPAEYTMNEFISAYLRKMIRSGYIITMNEKRYMPFFARPLYIKDLVTV